MQDPAKANIRYFLVYFSIHFGEVVANRPQTACYVALQKATSYDHFFFFSFFFCFAAKRQGLELTTQELHLKLML